MEIKETEILSDIFALCDLTRKIRPEADLCDGSRITRKFSLQIFDDIFVELKALELPQPCEKK